MNFQASIKAELTLTREEVEYLAMMAENHYDARVKAQVPPGPGATINGMRFLLLPDKQEMTHFYSFREIDLLAKTVETDFGGAGDAARMKMNFHLQRMFFTACRRINDITKTINPLIDALTNNSPLK